MISQIIGYFCILMFIMSIIVAYNYYCEKRQDYKHVEIIGIIYLLIAAICFK